VTFAGHRRALVLTPLDHPEASLSISNQEGAGLATLGIEDADMTVSTPAERDFIATTVHELRSPLTTINGQVQLARRFVEPSTTAPS